MADNNELDKDYIIIYVHTRIKYRCTKLKGMLHNKVNGDYRHLCRQSITLQQVLAILLQYIQYFNTLYTFHKCIHTLSTAHFIQCKVSMSHCIR